MTLFIPSKNITRKEIQRAAWCGFSSHHLFVSVVLLVPSSKLSVVVVRKKCMARFFMEANHTVQNPPLGTAVDSEATRPGRHVLSEAALEAVTVRAAQGWGLLLAACLTSLPFLSPQLRLLLGQPGGLSGNC